MPDNILRSSLSFNLNCNTTAEITRPCASFSTPRLRNLLEPLRLLHGFQFVSITGPLDEKYKTELCLSICKKAPTFQESLFKLLHESKKGDEAFKAGGSAPDRLRRAIRIYNGVMTDLKDQCARFDRAVLQSRTRSATTPVVADVILHIGYTDLVFKLEHKLAMAHYRLSQYEEARKWSARAVKTIVEDWAPLVANRLVDPRYAYAYQLNARANRSLGRYKEAVEAMEGAVRMAPHLAKVLQLYRDEEGWHREMQRKTVKMVLDGGRDRKGRRFVMRYPADFEDVKRRLPEQCA